MRLRYPTVAANGKLLAEKLSSELSSRAVQRLSASVRRPFPRIPCRLDQHQKQRGRLLRPLFRRGAGVPGDPVAHHFRQGFDFLTAGPMHSNMLVVSARRSSARTDRPPCRAETSSAGVAAPGEKSADPTGSTRAGAGKSSRSVCFKKSAVAITMQFGDQRCHSLAAGHLRATGAGQSQNSAAAIPKPFRVCMSIRPLLARQQAVQSGAGLAGETPALQTR